MIAKALIGGGQTWAHRVRMLKQILRITFYTSLGIALAVFIINTSSLDTVFFQSAWYKAKAEICHITNSPTEISKEFYSKLYRVSVSNNKTINSAEAISKIDPFFSYFLEQIFKNLKISLEWFLCSFPSILVFFFIRGRMSTKSKVVSGNKIHCAWRTNLSNKIRRKSSPLKIGNLHLVRGSENQHILITGCTGSGKTNAIHSFLKSINPNKEKIVLVDNTGEFLQKYYKKDRDVVLNPFLENHALWSPWNECRSTFDFDNLAKSFIPHSNNEQESFWRNSARSFFSSMLQLHQEPKNLEKLYQELLYLPLPKIFKKLEGTKAAAYLDPSSERTAGSIRSVASSYLECLELLGKKQGAFSIRNWICEKNNGFLFLNSSPQQRASLTPLLSAWFSISISSLMKLDIDPNRRVWFLVDELASLQHLPDLETFVTESRKFGGCAVLATQNLSQLDDIYGKSSQTILGNIATRIVFAEKNPVLAKRTSEIFGENEELSYQESISYGANDIRDGVNLNHSQKTKPSVAPQLIQNLKTNQGIALLPSNKKISKLKVPFPEN
jgi:type IV conjugative transfer system coupling protein TraD